MDSKVCELSNFFSPAYPLTQAETHKSASTAHLNHQLSSYIRYSLPVMSDNAFMAWHSYCQIHLLVNLMAVSSHKERFYKTRCNYVRSSLGAQAPPQPLVPTVKIGQCSQQAWVTQTFSLVLFMFRSPVVESDVPLNTIMNSVNFLT